MNTLTRVLKPGITPGKDVEGFTRAMLRFLDDGPNWTAFYASLPAVRRRWGPTKVELAKRCAKKLGLPQYGVAGPELEAGLRKAGAFDATANRLLDEYAASVAPPPPQLVFPIDKDWPVARPTFLHPTGGIPGNWSLDFMCAPGGIVVAPEAGTVSRTAGHDPSSGLHGANRDVFGWSVYLRCKTGFFYSTHYGRLAVRAGQSVKARDVLGYVGNWPYDRGRSHLHLGFTSFTMLSAVSKRKIQAVAAAPRVEANAGL